MRFGADRVDISVVIDEINEVVAVWNGLGHCLSGDLELALKVDMLTQY